MEDVSNATNERTCIATIIPKVAASRTCPALGLTSNLNPTLLLANLNSIIFDYIARQKVGGIHFNWTLLSQLPVLPPEAYRPADIDFIAPRVLELVYTAYDLRPFAQDLWEWGIGNRQSENQGAGTGNGEWGVGSSATPHSLLTTPQLRELYIKQWENSHGQSIHSILPRLASLARSNDTGRDVLSSDQSLSEGRTLRHDQPDTQSGSVSPSEHSGGVREGESRGLHSVSANRAGVSQGTGDSPDPFDASRTYDERVYRAIANAMRDGWQNPESLDTLVTEAGLGSREWGVEGEQWKRFLNYLLTTPDAPLPLSPFRWDEVRRAQLRAELDAYYARLYGLTRDELRYILDPKEVHGDDFPGETFRVLKEKEIRRYGEFRTRRLVLDAWDALAKDEGGRMKDERGQLSVSSNQSSVSNTPVKEEDKEGRSTPIAAPKPVEENPAQPMLSDFGLYKCVQCEKMVMGFEKDVHVAEVHKGKSAEWKKIR